MEGIDFEREDAMPPLPWASWDFYPSPWNGGILIAHCTDKPTAPFVGVAAPGVSLCGESGFETARWRRGEWPTVGDFLSHGEPRRLETVELSCIRADLPDDFDEWAARATVAHIDRLRSFVLHRPEESEAADLADALHVEMEDAYPGAMERLSMDFCGIPVLGEVEKGASLRMQLLERFPVLRIPTVKALDLTGQAVGFLILYGLYRLVRELVSEPWAPEGKQIGLRTAFQVPVGEFALWLYGLGHVLLPVAFLGWVYFRRQASFAFARNAMVLAAVLSVAAYLLYSPGAVYAVGFAESVPANALPTMPALHLAVAFGLGYFGVRLSRSVAARAFWVAYAMVATWVVVISGSRYPVPTIAFAAMVATISLVLADRLVSRLWLPIDLFGRWRQDPANARQPH
jgi:hypothetical protein